jgi:hypothetical protein
MEPAQRDDDPEQPAEWQKVVAEKSHDVLLEMGVERESFRRE